MPEGRRLTLGTATIDGDSLGVSLEEGPKLTLGGAICDGISLPLLGRLVLLGDPVSEGNDD